MSASVFHNLVVPTFFSAPRAGRKIVAGFSYLQRIARGATTKVWFPENFDPSIEWAAVRQFELLQEAGNLSIDDLEVADFKRSFERLMKMRAGGYRVTIITLGRYEDNAQRDDLEILDKRFQDEITQLVHFLYLSEQSEAASAAHKKEIRRGAWNVAAALPHVAMTVSAKNLLKPEKRSLAEETFFEILSKIPSRHILHDVAVGLTLPEATKEKNWVYLAADEHKFTSFQRTMDTVFRGFEDAFVGAHMRGYGDHVCGGGFSRMGLAF